VGTRETQRVRGFSIAPDYGIGLATIAKPAALRENVEGPETSGGRPPEPILTSIAHLSYHSRLNPVETLLTGKSRSEMPRPASG
jgi:hypothetical protein